MRALCPLVTALALLACDPPQFVSDLDAGPRRVGVQPPARTTVPDEEDLPARVLVLRDVMLGADPARGWDLDQRCTEAPEPPATQWERECAPTNDDGAHVIDLEGCRDDAFGSEVADAFGPLGARLEEALRLSMTDGVGPLMVRVTGWSGAVDDPAIVVEVVPVAFGVPAGGIRGDLLAWDGTDAFHPFASALDAEDVAIVVDEEAYVTDGVLVARFEAATFPLRGRDRSLTLGLSEALLTLPITPDADVVDDVVLAGRWPVDAVLGELDAAGLCDGDPLRVSAEIRIRDTPDVREISRGGAGRDAPCEALSVTVGFVGYPGVWGDVREPDTPPPAPCGDP